MTIPAFDSQRYARRLCDAGVPEPQADAQAELMAETLGWFSEKLLTRDFFAEVLDARFAAQDAKIEARFAKYDAKFELRFAQQDAKSEVRFAEQAAQMEKHFARQDATLRLHSWMLGLVILVVVVPTLLEWFG